MTAPKARTAGERLQLARAEVPKVEARIDAGMDRRRVLLLEGDANSLACINVDREIARLRDLRLRLVHQIDLLGAAAPPPRADPQLQGWTWPSDLPSATVALAQIQPELLRLRSIKYRSATDDDHINSLVKREYALLRLIESFQPKKMTAA